MDPLMRAAALGQLGRQKEAKEAIEQLLKIEPNFKRQAYEIIGRLVKVDDLIDKIIFGLKKAGIDEFD
jgi:adenylate cyclase